MKPPAIHPFEDGNGRVGRAVVDLALAQDLQRPSRLLGLSAAMRRHQDAHYDALNAAQRGDGDVTAWLVGFSTSTSTPVAAAAC